MSSIFQKISSKSKSDVLGHAFYKIRHYSNAKISNEEKKLMREYACHFIYKRDELNNADYWLLCRLFNLKDNRSISPDDLVLLPIEDFKILKSKAEKYDAIRFKNSKSRKLANDRMTPEERSAAARKAGLAGGRGRKKVI